MVYGILYVSALVHLVVESDFCRYQRFDVARPTTGKKARRLTGSWSGGKDRKSQIANADGNCRVCRAALGRKGSTRNTGDQNPSPASKGWTDLFAGLFFSFSFFSFSSKLASPYPQLASPRVLSFS